MKLNKSQKKFLWYLAWLACYWTLIQFFIASTDSFFRLLLLDSTLSIKGMFSVVLSIWGFWVLGWAGHHELDIWNQ